MAHLAAADANVLIALRTPEAFDAVLKQVEAAGSQHADLEAAAGLRDVPFDHGFPWYGAQLTAELMVPLRLMETWAHGQDVLDALGVPHRPTARLRHVASRGVVGRDLSFYAAQLPPPAEPFRVELTGVPSRDRPHRSRRGRPEMARHRPRFPLMR
uniref:hypothetical protein n=1 Tax=Nonomuraea endophytica TaxID=714136 RepID=UPI0028B20AD4|nr:hypothetical protein [Nonomuraea endophytica]